MVKIVHNKLLGGWYIVKGPHHTPISGRFDTKAGAREYLGRAGALRELNNQIAAGREFPDIVGRIARNYGISEAALTRAYDREEA